MKEVEDLSSGLKGLIEDLDLNLIEVIEGLDLVEVIKGLDSIEAVRVLPSEASPEALILDLIDLS